ncbi:MAG TPA: hypothetical protein VN277_00330 [Acidiferrobacterales bacterium]|nr:hypothetical protein [Acidiferrobacterales bacterium]
MKTLLALLLAGCVATAAQAAPTNPAAVNEFKSQMTLASKGDRDAQYRVGEMYEKGLGTDPDLPLAIIWYGRASQQGDNRASERLSALDRSNTREVKEKEQSRVDSVIKALRQQESDEAVRTRASREKAAADKAAADKAAAETRARQQAQAQDATARAREKAAADAAAARTRSELAKPALVPTARPAPVPAAKPAETPKKENVDSERAEFSSNPCKGPQAKFLSTCK